MAGNVMEFTDVNWRSEVLESPLPVLVDFWAPWCAPCRRLAPTIEKLADEYRGRVKFGKMDTDQNVEVPGDLQIKEIPTVVLFQGGRELDRLSGLNDEAQYQAALARLGLG